MWFKNITNTFFLFFRIFIISLATRNLNMKSEAWNSINWLNCTTFYTWPKPEHRLPAASVIISVLTITLETKQIYIV